MRLLRIDDPYEKTLRLVERVGNSIPPYLILSHTWGEDEDEVTFKDMRKGRGQDKEGYDKIRFCVRQALEHNLQYFWVDTCCIDKSSSAELSEAINSMHRWYQNSAVCVVLLSDVSAHKYIPGQGFADDIDDYNLDTDWIESSFEKFENARWFTRGWTLQELLAPKCIKFFSLEHEMLGDRSELVDKIYHATGIDKRALQGASLSEFSVEGRLSWAEGRSTKREEDAAYSLLGLFDIHMPLLYGEGKEKALYRLKKEITESMKDAPVLQTPAFGERQQKDSVEPEQARKEIRSSPLPELTNSENTLDTGIFPSLENDSDLDQQFRLEQAQQDDPLATQVWKHYFKSKDQLPNAERMANLVWRMMGMNLKRRREELGRNE